MARLKVNSRRYLCWLLLALGPVLVPAGWGMDDDAGASVDRAARFAFHPAPGLPVDLTEIALGAHSGIRIVAGGRHPDGGISEAVYVLRDGASAWELAGSLADPPAGAVAVSTGQGLIVAGGRTAEGPSRQVRLLSRADAALTVAALPDLPEAVEHPGGVAQGPVVTLGGRTDTGEVRFWALDLRFAERGWEVLPPAPVDPGEALVLMASQERLYLAGSDGAADYLTRDGWRRLAAPPDWPRAATAAAFGHAHIFIFGAWADEAPRMLALHTYTGTWVELDEGPDWPLRSPAALGFGPGVYVLDGIRATTMEVLPARTGYGLFDHAMVFLYLGGMIMVGFHFVRRQKNTNSFFRASNTIPWWAAGMSLFATGASAISLMSMPGKSFSTDLTYLGISLYAVMALPIALFILAPLVRKLAIATPGQYLERRFGLAARMLAASIYCFTQVGARMGAVMLLPSIAISAITGIEIWICILVMGVVTTIYTYLGGLAAVIWTDTIQGGVMVLSVVGCLALALYWLDAPAADTWETLRHFDKLVVFDLRWDLTYPTAYLLFITTVLGTLGGISDQNFVQRVQCTPDLRQTKLAVATQLAVAVPINILLFSLGLVLFLFYRQRPEQLDPTMQTDGIFPFFVAQQLPPGVSGLVIAALLAATMSTISSSICGVANVGMEDFARRFRPKMTDQTATRLGRILTAVIGIVGTGTALYLSQSELPSIWDLAQMVTNLISNGIVGFFALGLLTKRAHEWGAILGVACGMVSVYYLQNYTDISFWAFTFVGTVVTFSTGYLFSLLLPSQPRNISGLTVYTLREARPESEEQIAIVGTGRNAG
ncbi:MAG: hypothetical protein EA425_17950 [Puniceicoccaceae bacterium]|nr:MAG: hypothetical protein EA425_17950 [Puniceicoccaceae bacterium]